MTLDDLLSAKTVCYWDYGVPIEVKLTGRVIKAPTAALTYVEVKTGWFSKKWMKLPLLDVISIEEVK